MTKASVLTSGECPCSLPPFPSSKHQVSSSLDEAVLKILCVQREYCSSSEENRPIAAAPAGDSTFQPLMLTPDFSQEEVFFLLPSPKLDDCRQCPQLRISEISIFVQMRGRSSYRRLRIRSLPFQWPQNQHSLSVTLCTGALRCIGKDSAPNKHSNSPVGSAVQSTVFLVPEPPLCQPGRCCGLAVCTVLQSSGEFALL